MKAQASTQMKLCKQAAVVSYCGAKIWKIMEMTTLTYLSLPYKIFRMKYFLKQLSCFMMHSIGMYQSSKKIENTVWTFNDVLENL